MKPIVSIRDLCSRLGYPRERLRAIAADVKPHYLVWWQYNAKKGKRRDFQAPHDELKNIQYRIIAGVLKDYELSDAAHGAVKGRSPRTNAEAHLGADTLVNVDVVNFFPEVSFRQVFAMFRRDFGCSTEVASLLTKLTTFQGRLPTGAPTSPAIANALLTALVDRPLEAMAKELGVVYTRYIDDLSFSGANARLLINEAGTLLSRLGLKIHRKKKKLKIVRNHEQQIVTGLVINSKHGTSVGRRRIDQIRAQIFQLPTFHGEERSEQLRSIQGRINHVQQFNSGASTRLQRQLMAALSECG